MMKLPEWYENMLIKEYGIELKDKIVDGYNKKRVTSFRANKLKVKDNFVENELNKLNIKFNKYENIQNSFIVDNNVELNDKLRFSTMYENGEIYIQSLSSMLPPLILDSKEGEDILDMTAAPGGKTTEIAALTDNRANITAIEMNNSRFEKMKFNIEKQGANVYCLKQDARLISDYMKFDKILLDAPCSGSGTLNTNTNFEKYFTPQLINKTINLQEKLLTKALKIAKKGSIIIYSTCSILKEENEEILRKVIKKSESEIVPIEMKEDQYLKFLPTNIKGTICVMPNEFFEGFFISKIKKL